VRELTIGEPVQNTNEVVSKDSIKLEGENASVEGERVTFTGKMGTAWLPLKKTDRNMEVTVRVLQVTDREKLAFGFESSDFHSAELIDEEMSGISCSNRKVYNVMSVMKDFNIGTGDEITARIEKEHNTLEW